MLSTRVSLALVSHQLTAACPSTRLGFPQTGTEGCGVADRQVRERKAVAPSIRWLLCTQGPHENGIELCRRRRNPFSFNTSDGRNTNISASSELLERQWLYESLLSSPDLIDVYLQVHYYTHLETAPITGRRRYIIMSAEQLEFLSNLEKEKVSGYVAHARTRHRRRQSRLQIATMFANQMLPEKSKQTQLVARVAKRIIHANLDIPVLKTIPWSVRVVVSDLLARLDDDSISALVQRQG